MSLHVLIVGGGLGGLALAHGLRRRGLDVTVYEQDPAPDARPQGYRIHVDAAGHAALAECLPEDLFELYLATSTTPPATPSAVFFDNNFTETGAGDARVGDAEPARAPTAVDRLTLRQILLSRLDDTVHFGCRVVAVDDRAHEVRVHFADGRTATGDVLVAADGIGSAIREHLLPQVEVLDTGVRAITGKTPLRNVREYFPARLHNSFTGVHGPHYRTLAMALYQPRTPHRKAAAELAPDVVLEDIEDYLMWLALARAEDFPADEDELSRADPATLHRLALRMIEGWYPTLRALVDAADTPATFPLSIRAVPPLPTWPTGRVTLLGDAAHAMAPIGGRGGNTAFCDAASASAALEAVASGTLSLRSALIGYEGEMRERGSAAVVESLRMAGPSIGARSPYAMGSA